jgi:RNase P/RNase MRP subunit p29
LKPALQNSVNLVNVVDSNKHGLVAICEDQEVCLYAGSQFFEENNVNKDQEEFSFQSKDGNTLAKIDGQ